MRKNKGKKERIVKEINYGRTLLPAARCTMDACSGKSCKHWAPLFSKSNLNSSILSKPKWVIAGTNYVAVSYCWLVWKSVVCLSHNWMKLPNLGDGLVGSVSRRWSSCAEVLGPTPALGPNYHNIYIYVLLNCKRENFNVSIFFLFFLFLILRVRNIKFIFLSEIRFNIITRLYM